MPKSESKIIVHFGAGKTGSSAIQNFMLQNAEVLMRYGYYYPKHGIDQNGVSGGHGAFHRMIVNGNSEEAFDWLKKNYTKASENGCHLVISGESFNPIAKLASPIFARLTNRIEAVGYFRNPIEFLVSSYNQSVKRHNFSKTLKEHLENVLEKPPSAHLRGRYLREWIEAVGEAHIKIFPYDKNIFAPAGLEYHFLKHIGISDEKHSEFIKLNRRINSSYTPSAIYLKRELNKILDPNMGKINGKIDQALQQFSDSSQEPNSQFTDLLGYDLYKRLEDHFRQCIENLKTNILSPVDLPYWIYEKADFRSARPQTEIQHDPATVFSKALLKDAEICAYLRLQFKNRETTPKNLSKVKSLLTKNPLIAWTQRALQPLSSTKSTCPSRIKVKIVAAAKDESAYLAEWIFHHRWFGFHSISIYVNGSTDSTDEVSERFRDLEGVSFLDGNPFYKSHPDEPQPAIYRHAIKQAREEGFTHIQFLDIDEFWTPLDFRTSIKDCVAENKSDVIAFEWLNKADPKPFATTFETGSVRGAKVPLVKSCIRTDCQYLRINPHGIWQPKASYTLADESTFHATEKNYSQLEPKDMGPRYKQEPPKPYFIIHRANRSEIEYIARLCRVGSIFVNNKKFQFKHNRTGYVLGGPEISVDFNSERIAAYNTALNVFFEQYFPLQLAEKTQEEVLEKAQRTIQLVRNAETRQDAILAKILRSVTLPDVVEAYEFFKNKERVPVISFIISTFNRLDLTRRCLASLEESMIGGPEYEVIIVDDCSTDNTRDFLKRLNPPYKVILNEEKGSFAENNNRAASVARAEILCCLNNDTEVNGEWWQPMLKAAKNIEDAGCIGNVQRLADGNRFDHFGVCFPPWLVPIHFGQNSKNPPKFDGAYSRWGSVTAACMMIRKDRFLEVGGFDTDYINGCEDIDLCLRLHRRGYWHYVAHGSEIAHHKGASPGRTTYNSSNLERLLANHADYIGENFVERDRRLAARAYLQKIALKPLTVNLRKLITSIRNLRAATDTALQKPDCIKLQALEEQDPKIDQYPCLQQENR